MCPRKNTLVWHTELAVRLLEQINSAWHSGAKGSSWIEAIDNLPDYILIVNNSSYQISRTNWFKDQLICVDSKLTFVVREALYDEIKSIHLSESLLEKELGENRECHS